MARCYLWWLGVLGAACGARELDPAACAARFDVQRDKIIRTEESRDMGARYLSELDVGARPECLRLCCETESCDVFVYEEKGPGSCYLFACGPPEDFRCKFTAHGNFSSGVLALSRRLAELQDRERDLHVPVPVPSLRSTSSAAPPPPPRASDAPPARPAPRAGASPSHPDLLPAPGRCSRYQFECRRGGECIAVYNACDGVPQCADGSDEAPELACPAPPAPPAPPALVARLTPPPAQESPELGSNEGSELEAAAAAAAAAAASGERERWPHRLAQAQPQRRYPGAYDQAVIPEAGRGSHIFSHKGGLVQEAEAAGAAPYPPFEPPAPWPHRPWPAHRIESETAGGDGGWGAYSRPEWAEEARRAWPVPAPAPAPASAPRPAPRLAPGPARAVEVDPEVGYETGAATLRDSAKKGLSAAQEPRAAPPPAPPPAPAPAPASASAPTRAPPDRKTHNAKVLGPLPHVSAAGARAAGAVGAAGADGLSEHPPAAVLLLVLGMAMTVGLGGMLGVRMRAARRRLRRGKPFAHDADYLVNGMYL